MRKINCLYVPIPQPDGLPTDYLRITFPEITKTLAELAELPEIEIVTKIGTNFDLIGHTYKDTEFNVTDTYQVKSFQSALDHYYLIVHR